MEGIGDEYNPFTKKTALHLNKTLWKAIAPYKRVEKKEDEIRGSYQQTKTFTIEIDIWLALGFFVMSGKLWKVGCA